MSARVFISWSHGPLSMHRLTIFTLLEFGSLYATTTAKGLTLDTEEIPTRPPQVHLHLGLGLVGLYHLIDALMKERPK